MGNPRFGLRTARPATEPRDGPTRNFHEKYRKNTPRAEILEPQENTQKIPKKYQKCAFLVFWGYFLVFSGYFGGKFWESRISGRGVFFRYFSWKFRVGPFRGSVAGRAVLKVWNPSGLPSLNETTPEESKQGLSKWGAYFRSSPAAVRHGRIGPNRLRGRRQIGPEKVLISRRTQ